MNKLSVLALVSTVALSTGCANVHEFINGDFLNTVSPNTATALKMAFYSDRYEFNVTPEKLVPNDFANTAGDYWNGNKFAGFTRDEAIPRQYIANYYDPNFTKNGDIATTHVTSFYRLPQKTKAGKEFYSSDFVYQYNCSNLTAVGISGKAYSGKNLNGTVVADKVFPKKDLRWVPIVPGSLDDKVFNKVCK